MILNNYIKDFFTNVIIAPIAASTLFTLVTPFSYSSEMDHLERVRVEKIGQEFAPDTTPIYVVWNRTGFTQPAAINRRVRDMVISRDESAGTAITRSARYGLVTLNIAFVSGRFEEISTLSEWMMVEMSGLSAQREVAMTLGGSSITLGYEYSFPSLITGEISSFGIGTAGTMYHVTLEVDMNALLVEIIPATAKLIKTITTEYLFTGAGETIAEAIQRRLALPI